MEGAIPITPQSLNESPITFIKKDVLNSPIEQEERQRMLQTALKLGNNHKHKVRIYFMDINENTHQVVASVWAVTEKYVVLSGEAMIPINSIVTIERI